MSHVMKPPTTAQDFARLPSPPSNDNLGENTSTEGDDDPVADPTMRSLQMKEAAIHHESINHKLSVASNVIFVIASSLYVATEVTYLPYYRFYRDVPMEVRETENDDVWWQYYNDTDAFPDYLVNATDDEWSNWYNNSFLDEDEALNEFVFQVPNAHKKYNDPEETYEAWVSQYMMLYFLAALGFLFTGILEFTVATRNGHFWGRMLYYVMIVASLFGIGSAMMVNKDPWGSTVLNAISVHLFAVEAFAIVIARWRQTKQIAQAKTQDNDYNHGKFHRNTGSKKGLSIHGGILGDNSSACVTGWLFTGDFSFVIGTTGDVVLSYFYLFDQDFFEQCVAAITTACFWLLSSLIYLSVAGMDYHEFRQKCKSQQNSQDEQTQDVEKVNDEAAADKFMLKNMPSLD